MNVEDATMQDRVYGDPDDKPFERKASPETTRSRGVRKNSKKEQNQKKTTKKGTKED